jgi:hypothetical protein
VFVVVVPLPIDLVEDDLIPELSDSSSFFIGFFFINFWLILSSSVRIPSPLVGINADTTS